MDRLEVLEAQVAALSAHALWRETAFFTGTCLVIGLCVTVVAFDVAFIFTFWSRGKGNDGNR